VSLPSNPLTAVPVDYPTYPFCKHADERRQREDDGADFRGLKRCYQRSRAVFSSKWPRSMSAERNAVSDIGTSEKLYSDSYHIEGAWVPARVSPSTADLYLWKAKPRSAWHPPRERA
jgi:hypothetical protein